MRHSTRPAILCSAQLAFQRLDDAFEEDLAFAAQRVHLVGELLVGEGVGVAEGQVFQLAAQLAHAEAVGQRRVDVERLAGDLLPLLRRPGAPGCACCAGGRPA